MPTDPSDPQSPTRSTRPYQTDTNAPKSGGGGIFFVILLVLLLGGGVAYYFLSYKQTVAAIPAATPTPQPTVAPTAAPKPTPDTSGGATYSKAQRQQYIQTAIDAFKAQRQAKSQPFTEAYTAMTAAGGFSAASLTSKDAIAARREMVKKCLAANDDYTAFIKDQEAIYVAELKKTPLIPNDVEVESSYTGAKMPTDKIVQLRTIQGDSLKTGDQMLEYLDTKFGAWSVNAEKHIVFKKSADGTPFSTLAKTYSEQITSLNKLRDEINTNAEIDPTASSPTPAGTPAGTPVSSPAASPAPSAAP